MPPPPLIRAGLVVVFVAVVFAVAAVSSGVDFAGAAVAVAVGGAFAVVVAGIRLFKQMLEMIAETERYIDGTAISAAACVVLGYAELAQFLRAIAGFAQQGAPSHGLVCTHHRVRIDVSRRLRIQAPPKARIVYSAMHICEAKLTLEKNKDRKVDTEDWRYHFLLSCH